MKFSIVIPSLLLPYVGAAHDRERKILRAIASAQHQTFTDFEIIVIADGCQKTMDIVKYADNVRPFLIPRGKHFGGGPRNKGIEEAEGEYIIYLDIDDIYGLDHLAKIAEHLNSYDWVWFNDLRYKEVWYENQCDIMQVGRCGTSNIVHLRSLNVRWDVKGYAHDYWFIQHLLKVKNYAKIPTPEYYVAHVPNGRTKGYDI